ncbi:hypothetical protein AWB99_24505 [Mycolicibacterium confluentis]|uniref:Uncharacterized protein n=1 Tax=Mycolicibacterium confluentis TaxID=28047 RepID=A0A7I7XSN9_9MYCO|nr:hypothetical protein AWB99_24505 [Mycolicibacterium confluentis]BBZ31952.1 hypothetical protein MCNF_05570 [Mycolicibacterium confluentis]
MTIAVPTPENSQPASGLGAVGRLDAREPPGRDNWTVISSAPGGEWHGGGGGSGRAGALGAGALDTVALGAVALR